MVRKLAKSAFFIGLVAVIALSSLPQETLPETDTWDKLNHALAYGLLAVSGGIGFKGWRSLLMVGIGLVVLGAGLELVQSVIPDRDGSITDAVANFVGVAIGSLATGGRPHFCETHSGVRNNRRRAEKPEALEWPESINAIPIRCFPARDAAQEHEVGNLVDRLRCPARNDVACMAARKVRALREGTKTL